MVGAIILAVAMQSGYDPAELLAVAYTESRWKHDAIGPRESVGVLQINCKAWWKHFGYVSESACRSVLSTNTHMNIAASMYILRRYRKRYKRCSGDEVFACYNGGPNWRKLGDRARRRVQAYRSQVVTRRALIRPLLGGPIADVWKALRDHERSNGSLQPQLQRPRK